MTENYSRNLCNVPALSTFLLFSLILQAQSSGIQQSSLELRVTPHQLINGVPDRFSFVFVNVGDHEVRVPPMSPCMGGRYSGTLILDLEFQPSGPPTPGKGGGCGGGISHMPGILEQAKSWRSLQPGESVEVSRAFFVAKDANQAGIVVTHEGGFPIGWFIIGDDAWFRKPPVMKLDLT